MVRYSEPVPFTGSEYRTTWTQSFFGFPEVNVTVERSRILHKHDGTMEVPSAVAWDTSHQLMITRNLRDAVCDQMSDQSTRKSRADVCQYAGDENLLGSSTIIDIVHQEGEHLIAAQRQRARAILAEASETQLAMLGPLPADPDAVTGSGR